MGFARGLGVVQGQQVVVDSLSVQSTEGIISLSNIVAEQVLVSTTAVAIAAMRPMFGMVWWLVELWVCWFVEPQLSTFGGSIEVSGLTLPQRGVFQAETDSGSCADVAV